MAEEKNNFRQKTRAAAIILAGGAGVRMGGDKQYMLVAGRPVIEHTADAFIKSGLFDEIIVALTPENASRHGDYWKDKGIKVAPAGATRMGSLRNSFALLSPGMEIVAVHDGARPFITEPIIRECLEKAKECGAAVPGVPLKDTVKRFSKEDGTYQETLNRSEYMAVQTPQCYRYSVLADIMKAADGGKDYTDESQVLEHLGINPAVSRGCYRNIKITTPEDLLIAEAFAANPVPAGKNGNCAAEMAAERRCPDSAGGHCEKHGDCGNDACAVAEHKDCSGAKYAMPRSGFGYDLHRLVPGRPLKMAGITIEHDKGLLGHSDGDVVLHAVCDALLGAIAAGEIGIFFPPENKDIKGIDSVIIAKKTMDMLKERHASIINMDVTIVAEEPKMKKHYAAMRESLARIFEMPLEDVSVKAKSHEGLDSVGQHCAIECYAAANVIKK